VAAIRQRIDQQLNLDNDWVRHGVRLAILIGVTTLITDITTYPHDYWLPMTVAWISKPDRDGTATKIIERIAGTIAGVLIAVLLVDVLHLGRIELAVAAGLGSALAVMFVRANYSIAVVGVTLLVVCLFTFDGDPVVQTVVLRVILTVLAGVAAFLGFYIWPPARGSSAQSVTR
jgi:uncharacterized membrane protein YccC